jgi:hypothetical protein
LKLKVAGPITVVVVFATSTLTVTFPTGMTKVALSGLIGSETTLVFLARFRVAHTRVPRPLDTGVLRDRPVAITCLWRDDSATSALSRLAQGRSDKSLLSTDPSRNSQKLWIGPTR